jgi:hypothetical protein
MGTKGEDEDGDVWNGLLLETAKRIRRPPEAGMLTPQPGPGCMRLAARCPNLSVCGKPGTVNPRRHWDGVGVPAVACALDITIPRVAGQSLASTGLMRCLSGASPGPVYTLPRCALLLPGLQHARKHQQLHHPRCKSIRHSRRRCSQGSRLAVAPTCRR